MPQAFAINILAWGMLEFKEGYQIAQEWDTALNIVKWGLDWLKNCHYQSDTLVGQVGITSNEYSFWGRPEDMDMTRPVFEINPENPGSDLAGQVAATFASGAVLFKDTDSEYAEDLLQRAVELHDFAVDHQGKYSDAIPERVLQLHIF